MALRSDDLRAAHLKNFAREGDLRIGAGDDDHGRVELSPIPDSLLDAGEDLRRQALEMKNSDYGKYLMEISGTKRSELVKWL